MGQFPICKLKWDFLRTSFTACTNDINVFSAPIGIFYAQIEIYKQNFQENPLQPPKWVLHICKLLFSNGVCRWNNCTFGSTSFADVMCLYSEQLILCVPPMTVLDVKSVSFIIFKGVHNVLNLVLVIFLNSSRVILKIVL